MFTTDQEKLQQSILDQLLKLTGRTLQDEEVTFEGDRIVLPAKTTLDDNIDFLTQLRDEYEEPVHFSRQFNFKVWDVANATAQSLRKAFGSLRHKGTFFQPAQMVDVPDGPHSTRQVPFGQFIVPALPDVEFHVQGVNDDKYGQIGVLTAFGPKKHKAHIESIFDIVGEYLKTDSMYRGKAFTDGDKPEFIDTDVIDPSKIVYSKEVSTQLAANVYVRLDHPNEMRKLGIPFKSAILLEGEFGVGKTEALNLIAKRAVEARRKVTFIKVAPGGDLMQAMQTARMYAPAVVAFEDVDAVADVNNESDRIQAVLEAFDGQQAKLNDVMVLITTNYVESLHKGMVRPGRIDTIIHIGPPDAEGIRRLIEVRTPTGLLAADIGWDEVAEAMEGYFPSFVVESTTRAMRHAVVRRGGELNGDGLTTEDLVGAANELRPQFDLHRAAGTGTEKPLLDQAMRELVKETVRGSDSLALEIAEHTSVEEEATRELVAKKAKALAQHVTAEVEAARQVTREDGYETRETVIEHS